MEAVTKWVDSAASRKTKSRGPRSGEAPGRRLGKRTAAGWDASLDLGPLDLVFLEAALAANLITASISLHASNLGMVVAKNRICLNPQSLSGGTLTACHEALT